MQYPLHNRGKRYSDKSQIKISSLESLVLGRHVAAFSLSSGAVLTNFLLEKLSNLSSLGLIQTLLLTSAADVHQHALYCLFKLALTRCRPMILLRVLQGLANSHQRSVHCKL